MTKTGTSVSTSTPTTAIQDDRVAAVFIPQIRGNGTRAVDTNWSEGDRVGVWMVTGSEEEGQTEFIEYRVEASGPSANLTVVDFDKTLYYPDDDSQVTFVAFSPIVDEIEDNTVTYEGFENQTALELMEKVDFMYHRDDEMYSKIDRIVPLNFTHMLSKIVINVSTNNESHTEEILSNLSIVITGTPISMTAYLTDGTVDAGTTTGYIYPYHDQNSGYVYKAIVVPHEGSGDNVREVIFTYLDKETVYTFPDNFNFEAKKMYTLNFKVSNDEIILNNTTINPWEGGETIYYGGYYLDVDDFNSYFDKDGCARNFTFQSNYVTELDIAFSTSEDINGDKPNWITTENMGKNDYESFSQYTCDVVVSYNESNDKREAYLLAVDKEDGTVRHTIKISQEGISPYLTINNDQPIITLNSNTTKYPLSGNVDISSITLERGFAEATGTTIEIVNRTTGWLVIPACEWETDETVEDEGAFIRLPDGTPVLARVVLNGTYEMFQQQRTECEKNGWTAPIIVEE